MKSRHSDCYENDNKPFNDGWYTIVKIYTCYIHHYACSTEETSFSEKDGLEFLDS